MLNRISRIAAVLLALLTVLPAPAAHKNFKVSVYVRAYEVQKMKDREWLESSWKIISDQLDVDKIYLETHRDLLIVDDETLEQAKAFFLKQGLEVAGGITYTINESNEFETFSYSDPEDRAMVRTSTSFCWTTSSSPAARRTSRSRPRGTGAGPSTVWPC